MFSKKPPRFNNIDKEPVEFRHKISIYFLFQIDIFNNTESAVKWRRRFESEMNLPKSGVEYRYSSNENSFNEDRSFQSTERNYINYRQKKMPAFNPNWYKKEKWLYDTPGVILLEQAQTNILYLFFCLRWLINVNLNQILVSVLDG